MTDWRAEVARFYDLAPHHPKDVPFYRVLLPTADSSVLELGCGTGRVTVPIARDAGYVLGLDSSASMLAVCQKKLQAAGLPPARAEVRHSDITDFQVEQRFDLIIAPFRVLQNLASDEEVDALFQRIAEHLAPDGHCVLNVFNPNRERAAMIDEWPTPGEHLAWEVADGDTTVRCYDRRPRVQAEPLVLFPELIYRRYVEEQVVAEATLKIAMRCYYPEEFVQLIASKGFEVVDRWGGYGGEAYGVGPELVVRFRHARR